MYLHLLKYYAETIRWRRLDADATRRLQVDEFRRIFEYARSHSRFYRELYGDAGILDLRIRSSEDIARVPVIDKGMIRDLPPDEFLTVPVSTPDLQTSKSSGSTGEPMTLYATRAEFFTSYVRVFQALRRCGYTPLRSIACVFRFDDDHELPAEREMGLLRLLQRRLGLFRRDFLSVFEPVDEIIEKLQTSRPDLLWAIPSTMAIIARRLEDRGMNLDIPFAFAPSEPLPQSIRGLLEARVARRIVGAYGLQECPMIAVEAPDAREHGRMDVFAESVLVDLRPRPDLAAAAASADAATDEIVITNLVNRTMPIIRYATGDLCRRFADPGFPHRVLGPVLGRTDDTLELSDGTEFAIAQAYETFVDLTEARQWKLVGTPTGLELHLSLHARCRGHEDEIAQRARAMWSKRCPDEALEIVFTEEFDPDPRTGKTKQIEDRSRE